MNIIAYSRHEIEDDLTARVRPTSYETVGLIEETAQMATRLQLAFFMLMTGADTDATYTKFLSKMIDLLVKSFYRLGIEQTEWSMAAQIVDRCLSLAISFEDIGKALAQDIAPTGGNAGSGDE